MSIKSVNIVFFSGTGGTRRVAEGLLTSFKSRNIHVNALELNSKPIEFVPADFLIVLYPVYACNAPLPIYEWIETAPLGNGTNAAVISVSGGGSVTPNTACRTHCIKTLTKKGYNVTYEKMLCMPSNWIIRGDDRIMILLLRAMKVNVNKITDDINNNITLKEKSKLIDRFFSMLGKTEKIYAKKFGKKIIVTKDCVGCSICSRLCPRGNITIADGKPVFSDKCIICLNCIYSCPKKALKPGTAKFVVIKEGFNIDEVERKYGALTDIPPIDEMAKGWAWGGVRKYIHETEALEVGKSKE